MVWPRRLAQVSSSDNEEKSVRETRSQGQNSRKLEEKMEGKRRNRKMGRVYEESNDDEEEKAKDDEDEERKDGGEKLHGAKPVGEPVKVTGKGKEIRTHYGQFEYGGHRYKLEESVLLYPEYNSQKPYIAIIKDITQRIDGRMMILGQWFYRREEAKKKGGGNWEANDTRELFYSFHRDEFPAESVLHRCVVYFVPAHKQLPKRKKNPGFIVRRVYDTDEKKLWEFTDKVYEVAKQHEIDLFVEKSMLRLGDLPDLETEEDLEKANKSSRKVNIPSVYVSKEEDEYHSILRKINSLTDDAYRNKGLAKLLKAVHNICSNAGDEATVGSAGSHLEQAESGSLENPLKNESFLWPDAAVRPVCALESALHVSLASNYSKYNQRIWALAFNLKNTALLAKRLLNGELEPAKILNMSPSELKEGLTDEETKKNAPDDVERMQMTDVRCSRCSEIKVGLKDIIQAGNGDRYQMECMTCGHSWYASRDEVSTQTKDSEQPAQGTKTADAEKNLTSPPEAEKKATEESLKTTNGSNADHNPEATK
ncbi:Bromo adjacent homology (BAH) domain-containing protein [Hirschfeldia incana]|nr:Bromo adjacent homology (BAH) domain-containing protein [Hirschfeldia incana]